MGFFSREEFSRGLRALGATTLDKLKKALPKLEEEVDSNPAAFSSFFTFAFKFCLTVSLFRVRNTAVNTENNAACLRKLSEQ